LRAFSRAERGGWILALLAFAFLLSYGYRSNHLNFRGDDAQLYVGVKQLLRHRTFYRGIDYILIAKPGQRLDADDRVSFNAYPPATALFYFPFSLFPWPIARDLWYFCSMGCLFALGLVLFDLFGTRLPRVCKPFWLLALFLSTPPTSVVRYGSISFPMLLALALAWRQMLRPGKRSAALAGFWYAIALLKLTIALPFLAYHLLRRPARTVALYALGITLALNLAVSVFGHGPLTMLSEYRATLHTLTAPGGFNDTGYTGRRRYYLTNLGIAVFDAIRLVNGPHPGPETPGELLADRIVEWVFGLGVAGLFIRYALRRNAEEAKLEEGLSAKTPEETRARHGLEDWALAGLSVCSLVVFYHGWVDLGLLYIPLILALNRLPGSVGAARTHLKILLAALILLLFVLARNAVITRFKGQEEIAFFLSYALARLLLIAVLCYFLALMTAEKRRPEPVAVGSVSPSPAE